MDHTRSSGRTLPPLPRLPPIKRQGSTDILPPTPTVQSIPSWETEPLAPIQTTPSTPSHSPRPSPPREPLGNRRRRPIPPKVKVYMRKKISGNFTREDTYISQEKLPKSSVESGSDESMAPQSDTSMMSVSSSGYNDKHGGSLESSPLGYDNRDNMNRLPRSAFQPYKRLSKIGSLPANQESGSQANSLASAEKAIKVPVTVIRTDQVVKNTSSTEVAFHDLGSQSNNQMTLQPIGDRNGEDTSSSGSTPKPVSFHQTYKLNCKLLKSQSDISDNSLRVPFHNAKKPQDKRYWKSQGIKHPIGTLAVIPTDTVSIKNEANTAEEIKQDARPSAIILPISKDSLLGGLQETDAKKKSPQKKTTKTKMNITRYKKNVKDVTTKRQKPITHVTLHFQWPPKSLFKIRPTICRTCGSVHFSSTYGIVKNWVKTNTPETVKATAKVTKRVIGGVIHVGKIILQELFPELFLKNDEDEVQPTVPDKRIWKEMNPIAKEHVEEQIMNMTMNTKSRCKDLEMEKVSKSEESKPSKDRPPTREEHLLTYASELSREEPPIDLSRIKKAPPKEKKRLRDDIRLHQFHQTLRTESAFENLTKMRQEKGLLNIKYEKEYQKETSVKFHPKQQAASRNDEPKQPKTAAEAFDQLFPEGTRSWYPQSMKTKVAARRAMNVMRETAKETSLTKANTSSPRDDVPYHPGLMKVIQEVGADFNANKKGKECPVQWRDMLKPKYPCPSLDKWPEWQDIKDTIAYTTKSLEKRRNGLLQRQEEMRRFSRLQTTMQMRDLDNRRHADAANTMHPWIFSTEGKQDRRMQRRLHEKTLGKDAYMGCGGCRMQGYEMSLRDNRPHTIMYPGLSECVFDDYGKRVATDMDLLQLVKEGYGGKIRG